MSKKAGAFVSLRIDFVPKSATSRDLFILVKNALAVNFSPYEVNPSFRFMLYASLMSSQGETTRQRKETKVAFVDFETHADALSVTRKNS
jgi:hypothetical protein